MRFYTGFDEKLKIYPYKKMVLDFLYKSEKEKKQDQYGITHLYYNENTKELHIYAKRVGILIGYKGENINKLEEHFGCKVKTFEASLFKEGIFYVQVGLFFSYFDGIFVGDGYAVPPTPNTHNTDKMGVCYVDYNSKTNTLTVWLKKPYLILGQEGEILDKFEDHIQANVRVEYVNILG